MEALRKTIEDATPQIIIDLPKQYEHQRIEVIVRPWKKRGSNTENTISLI